MNIYKLRGTLCTRVNKPDLSESWPAQSNLPIVAIKAEATILDFGFWEHLVNIMNN